MVKSAGPADPIATLETASSVTNRMSATTLIDARGMIPPGDFVPFAEKTGRKKSNLSRTLKTMEGYGLVNLKKEDGRLVTTVPYSNISLVMPIHAM